MFETNRIEYKRELNTDVDIEKEVYVAYILADVNNNSIKVAKYKGVSRVDLIESNEYGYCSLIKATKL